MGEVQLVDAANTLLDAAHEYWKACQKFNEVGAVRWLEDDGGRLLIFTRGEYREQIMANIENLRPTMTFGESHIPPLPADGEVEGE